MSHILTLELPDEVFAELEHSAASLGVDVSQYCLSRLKNGVPDTLTLEEVERHPLMQLAGIFNSDTPDLAERHDFYLAEEVMNSHDNEK